MENRASINPEMLESVLLTEVRSLLNVSEISPEDNFFDRGGHSILAARLIGRMEPVIGQRAPLRHVFESQDLRELAMRLAAVGAQAGDQP